MISKFIRNTSGNIAMMFGLLTVPLIAATGAAIDYSRAYEQRMVVQDALDAAALAANRMIGNFTEAEIIAEAQAFFAANIAGRLDTSPTIQVQVDSAQGIIVITTDLGVPTSFLGIIGIDNINFDVMARTVTGGRDLEVALVLDITGSMLGQKIADLRAAATSLVNMVIRDVQTPYYSKLALIPYSMGVNVGTYAANVRGATTPSRTVTGVAWQIGTTRNITAITRNNPSAGSTRITTSGAHGLVVGDTVYLSGINGGSGMTNLNNNRYTVTAIPSSTQFRIAVNSNSWSNWTSGGTTRECATANCELVVNATAHGLAAGQYAYLSGLAGSLGTTLNNKAWTVVAVPASSGLNTSNYYALSGTNGPTLSAYTSGGTSNCLTVGCQYYRFMNAQSPSVAAILPVSTCVSERLGAQAYTDAAPGGAPVGWAYVSTDNPCPTNQIVPLTSNKTTLNAQIATYQAVGSTAGQIGIGWGWYMLAPNFASLWPAASQPAAYNTDELLKVAVIMTDGEFNTGYCNHTISRNYYALTTSANRSGCDGTNGNPATQALALCNAMKAQGIVVYTVGFDLDDADALALLEDCASSPAHFYVADNGADLQLAFAAIGTEISRLRIAE